MRPSGLCAENSQEWFGFVGTREILWIDRLEIVIDGHYRPPVQHGSQGMLLHDSTHSALFQRRWPLGAQSFGQGTIFD